VYPEGVSPPFHPLQRFQTETAAKAPHPVSPFHRFTQRRGRDYSYLRSDLLRPEADRRAASGTALTEFSAVLAEPLCNLPRGQRDRRAAQYVVYVSAHSMHRAVRRGLVVVAGDRPNPSLRVELDQRSPFILGVPSASRIGTEGVLPLLQPD
jgi:hypothetical protein